MTEIQFPHKHYEGHRVLDRFLTLYLRIGDLPASTDSEAEQANESEYPVFKAAIAAVEKATDALPRRMVEDHESEYERWTFCEQSGDTRIEAGGLSWPLEFVVAHSFTPSDYQDVRAAAAAAVATVSQQLGVRIEVTGADFQVDYISSTTHRLP